MLNETYIEPGVKVVWFYGGDIANQPQVDRQHWKQIINHLGMQSAKTQRLAGPITTYEKLISTAQHHRLYIIMRKVSDIYEATGILKTGEKRIFHMNDSGNIEHLKYLCLLDFYVESSVQRQGYGKILLDTMISREPTLESVKDLCVDRPTENCLTLLQKYYNVKPIRVGIDGNFCVFSESRLLNQSNLPSQPPQFDSQSDNQATSIYYDKI